MKDTESLTEKLKLASLSTLAIATRAPFVRGKVTISETVYHLLKPNRTFVTMNVGKLPVTLDLSQQELRYVYFGAYEKAEVRFLRGYLNVGDVAVDVGANYGYLAAVMVDRVGAKGGVYAFEPNPRVWTCLEETATYSGGVMKTYCLALASQAAITDGKIKLFVNPEHSMWSSIFADVTGTDQPQILEIKATTLSDFLLSREVERVDLIKIDVEGAEFEVLSGLLSFLSSRKLPTILCEFAGWDKASGVDVYDQLLKLGYQPFEILSSGRLSHIEPKTLCYENRTRNIVLGVESELRSRQVI